MLVIVTVKVSRDGTTQGQRGAMRLPPTFEKKNTIMYIKLCTLTKRILILALNILGSPSPKNLQTDPRNLTNR